MALTTSIAAVATPAARNDVETLLIVTGDPELLGLLCATFHLRGLRVLSAPGAAEARRLVRPEARQFPMLAIALIGLPEAEGLALGQELLQRLSDLSLILLLDPGSIEGKVQALHSGADDCLGKPFAWAELVVRVERSLRRRQLHPLFLRCGELVINLTQGSAQVYEQDVALSAQEYQFLCCLAQARGQVVSYDTIAGRLWPKREVLGSEEELVKKVKLHLQARLEQAAPGVQVLHNVPRQGYYLEWWAPVIDSAGQSGRAGCPGGSMEGWRGRRSPRER
jgi:DNA-binding response OmpR family regulator